MDLRAIVFSLGLLVSAGPALGQCQLQWSDWFQGNGTDDQVTAMAVYDDDGPGPHPSQLYIGGSFANVNCASGYGIGTQANWIAKWNDVSWSQVGTGIGHHPYSIDGRGATAMTVFNPNPGVSQPKLIVSGHFDHSNWWDSDRVQSWDGQHWTSLIGTHGSDWWTANTLGLGNVYCLAVHDVDGDGPNPPELFAGGNFDVNLGLRWPSHSVAGWDGTGWHGLSTGLTGSVSALASYDDDGRGPHLPKLIGGGYGFFLPGVDEPQCVAQWDGQTWSAIPGLRGNITSLVVFDEDGDGPRPASLFAIGYLIDIAGHGFGWIARWDGHSWSNVGSPPTAGPSASTSAIVFDPDGDGPEKPGLYVLGQYCGLAKWDGETWSQFVPSGRYDTGPTAVFRDVLGGSDRPELFLSAPAPLGPWVVGHFSKFDGEQWNPILSNGLDTLPGPPHVSVSCMAIGPDQPSQNNREALYAAGEFQTCGNHVTNGLAKWNGQSWESIDRDLSNVRWATNIAKMTFSQAAGSTVPELYVLSQFSISRRKSDGSWTQIGAVEGEYPFVSQMISLDDGRSPPNLYLVGSFASVGGIPARNIARWDGVSWHDVGGGVDGAIYCAAAYDEDGDGPMPPHLFIGGGFHLAESDPTWSHLASWDGSRFTAVDCPFDVIDRLCVFDEDGTGPLLPTLVAAGSSAFNADPSMYALARWDGTNWSGFNAFSNPSSRVFGFASFDEDGNGPLPPSLVVTGGFNEIGGLPARGLALWRAGQWSSPFGTGLFGLDLTSIVSFSENGPANPQALYFGGQIWTAGPYTSQGIARWGRPIPFIFKHPPSRTAALGGPTVFTIHASGAEPLTYQWRKDGHPLTDRPHIIGTNTPSLRLERINHTSEGDYDVIITNPCGTTISKPAHLTPAPAGRTRL